MKKLFKITILFALAVSLLVTGCSSSKGMGRKQCGCPSKTGMIGY